MLRNVSRVPLVLEIPSKGILECEAIRHLSPITVSALLRQLPIKGRIHRLGGDVIYVETGLDLGKEKQRSTFRSGEVAYLPSNGSLCVFLKNKVVYSMNPVGLVRTNLFLAENAEPGDVMILRRS